MRPGPTCTQSEKLAAVPSKSHEKPSSSAGGGTRATRWSPRRHDSATPDSIGFAEPTVGIVDGPSAYALTTWWKRPSGVVTDAAGSVPIHSVPASWCVVPSPSRCGTGAPPGSPPTMTARTSSAIRSIASHRSRSFVVCIVSPRRATAPGSPIVTTARRTPYSSTSSDNVMRLAGLWAWSSTDAAQRHHDLVRPDRAGAVHRTVVAVPWPQLGLGIGVQPGASVRRDLEVEVPDAAVGAAMRRAAPHEERCRGPGRARRQGARRAPGGRPGTCGSSGRATAGSSR